MSVPVTIDATRWAAAGGHLPGLAGHVRSSVAGGEPAQIVVVDGSEPAWAEIAEQATETASAVLLVDPALAPGHAALLALERLVQVARSAGCSLIVGDTWTGADTVGALREEWAAVSDDDVVLVDLAAVGESRLPRLFAVLHAGLDMLPTLVTAQTRENAVLASGRTGSSAPVMIRAIDADAGSGCTLTVVLRRGALTWTLPGRGDAAPGTVQISGPDGTRLVPTVYSSPYRDALLRAHAAVIAREAPPVDEVSPLLAACRHLDAELHRLRARPAPSSVPAPSSSEKDLL